MNNKILTFATTATLLAGFASSAFSANPRIISDERIDRAIEAQELAVALAPIKSRSDLARYLANNRSNPDNPLNAFSPRSKQRFLSSLRFGSQGLASFSYIEIESQLTVKQAHRLLSLFGAQAFTPQMTGLRREDANDRLIMRSAVEAIDDGGVVLLTNHWCSSRATCSTQSGSTCIVTSC
jgi:hypothetical protein